MTRSMRVVAPLLGIVPPPVVFGCDPIAGNLVSCGSRAIRVHETKAVSGEGRGNLKPWSLSRRSAMQRTPCGSNTMSVRFSKRRTFTRRRTASISSFWFARRSRESSSIRREIRSRDSRSRTSPAIEVSARRASGLPFRDEALPCRPRRREGALDQRAVTGRATTRLGLGLGARLWLLSSLSGIVCARDYSPGH